MSDLYRIDCDDSEHDTFFKHLSTCFAAVERCEHGFLEEHEFFVAKVDGSGLTYSAVEWCVGSPTLEVDDE